MWRRRFAGSHSNHNNCGSSSLPCGKLVGLCRSFKSTDRCVNAGGFVAWRERDRCRGKIRDRDNCWTHRVAHTAAPSHTQNTRRTQGPSNCGVWGGAFYADPATAQRYREGAAVFGLGCAHTHTHTCLCVSETWPFSLLSKCVSKWAFKTRTNLVN